MPIYISRGRFTSAAIKGMLAKPENREEAVAKLFKSVGGKLIGWYLTFGHHDWLAIGEFPNEKAAASAILAAAAGGSLSDIVRGPNLCRFLDAGDDEPLHPLMRPASKKRQGRKSRSVVHRRCRRRYGDLATGHGLMRLGDGDRCDRFAVSQR